MADGSTAAVELDADWKEVRVAYNRRDLLTYALGIGCTDLRHIYEDSEDFAPFPTYPVVLGFKGDAADVVSFPSPAMSEMTMPPLPGTKTFLDGERFIERVAPIPADGAQLVLRGKLVGVEPKGKGALIHMAGELRSAEGELFYRLDSTAFAVGAKGVQKVGSSTSEAVQTPARRADASHSERVGEQQAQLYRLSGDYNPLHIDPAIAGLSGFRAPILHGLCTLGFAVRAVLDRCAGGDSSKFRAVRARFVGPVLPGDTLRTRMWIDGCRIVFVTEVLPPGAAPDVHTTMRVAAI